MGSKLQKSFWFLVAKQCGVKWFQEWFMAIFTTSPCKPRCIALFCGFTRRWGCWLLVELFCFPTTLKPEANLQDTLEPPRETEEEEALWVLELLLSCKTGLKMMASGTLKHYCVQRQLNLAFDAFIYDAINNLIYAFSKDFDLFFSVTRFNFQVCLKTLFKETQSEN